MMGPNLLTITGARAFCCARTTSQTDAPGGTHATGDPILSIPTHFFLLPDPVSSSHSNPNYSHSRLHLLARSNTAASPAHLPLPRCSHGPSPSPTASAWRAVWSLDDQKRRRLLQIHDDLRHHAVRCFRAVYDAEEAGGSDREAVDAAVRHLYAPDLAAGWGVHVVQEVKLLARKDDRDGLDAAIQELVHIGIQRETAAETIYKEMCIAVNDRHSWAKYMSISGRMSTDIITLQYTEVGLLTIGENRDDRAAAFGDDIAIECLATEFKREVFVVKSML